MQGLNKVLGQEMIKLWNDLYNSTDSYTDGWLSSGMYFEYNIYLFLGQKIEIVQGLWYRMHMLKLKLRSFYSSWEVGKLQCFSWIKERFGRRNVRFCAIGDGPEECEAAQAMRWPFIKIDLRPSSPHRFPGLNMKMVQSCIDVIYGAADADAEEVNE
ncbi:hypothetical protein B296_00018437 [Ensete ventricosum]|uniref:protein-tyrosine-phosphatase n=1 Tax=Ensete ventricosum TaxID=4639 RepID=A0A427B1F2_ENSVE|nr:hypothetical protein B296_00018437 [Ensete ventricosum]